MNKPKLVEKRYLLPFILVTSLFALWGFANDVTHPMVATFQTLMELPVAQASLLQLAFYGGYATMAVPAALFVRRYNYKSGILLGLGLYALGAFLFIPAAQCQKFLFFCIALYVLTFGLAFLETVANPLILSLGAKETSTRRLNIAQSFNPVGSLSGMAVASMLVLPQLLSDKRDAAGEIIYHGLTSAEKADIRLHDLALIRDPYVAIGLVVLAVFAVFLFVKMPCVSSEKTKSANNRETLVRLWNNKIYRRGVFSQVFYVAAQIMMWTFIIQYANNLGMDKATAQNYNICAMMMFLCSRFITTYLMKYLNSRTLLALFGAGAVCTSLGAVLFVGMSGLYCLVATSFFMSLMFPTIYGIALENVDDRDTTLGAAFLVMAIVGGALLPPLQGAVIDLGTIAGMPAVNVSFLLPMCCFVVVMLYGIYAHKALVKSQK
ncbi:MAG: L-fucose:H+ symporter permease [Bacteroidaceae bacterium]|nr:L-fucose:H+ symporter permease [Bacteroidaceae bacterium]